jgi:hypothetical protein
MTALMLALVLAAQEPQEVPKDSDVLVVDDLKPGLVGRYFNLAKELKEFPKDLNPTSQPQQKRVDLQVNFEKEDGWGFGDLKFKECFAAVWTGMLRVPAAGKYTFYLKSDDGSKLYIDGKEVIDNDGKHRMDEDSKEIELTAGDHELKIEYFQNKDKAGCVFSWKYEGVDKQVVPASALWHKFERELDAK